MTAFDLPSLPLRKGLTKTIPAVNHKGPADMIATPEPKRKSGPAIVIMAFREGAARRENIEHVAANVRSRLFAKR